MNSHANPTIRSFSTEKRVRFRKHVEVFAIEESAPMEDAGKQGARCKSRIRSSKKCETELVYLVSAPSRLTRSPYKADRQQSQSRNSMVSVRKAGAPLQLPCLSEALGNRWSCKLSRCHLDGHRPPELPIRHAEVEATSDIIQKALECAGSLLV